MTIQDFVIQYLSFLCAPICQRLWLRHSLLSCTVSFPSSLQVILLCFFVSWCWLSSTHSYFQFCFLYFWLADYFTIILSILCAETKICTPRVKNVCTHQHKLVQLTGNAAANMVVSYSNSHWDGIFSVQLHTLEIKELMGGKPTSLTPKTLRIKCHVAKKIWV